MGRLKNPRIRGIIRVVLLRPRRLYPLIRYAEGHKPLALRVRLHTAPRQAHKKKGAARVAANHALLTIPPRI
jgi:hypothetical protein